MLTFFFFVQDKHLTRITKQLQFRWTTVCRLIRRMHLLNLKETLAFGSAKPNSALIAPWAGFCLAARGFFFYLPLSLFNGAAAAASS